MIIKNKKTKETVELSLAEFKIRFSKELKIALESYMQTELSKRYFKLNNSAESDFYFDLQWNFNHFGMSNWYIDKM